MTISGKIEHIMPEQVISEKFKKLEFVITTQDQYPQQILLQFINEKCQLAERMKIGQDATCHINIHGRKHINKEGKENWFNTLVCWRIELGEMPSRSHVTHDADGLPYNDGDLPF